MTDPLSPAARAVLDAYGDEVGIPRPYEHERHGLAAALRAAADQMAAWADNDGKIELDDLLAIANELDLPSS